MNNITTYYKVRFWWPTKDKRFTKGRKLAPSTFYYVYKNGKMVSRNVLNVDGGFKTCEPSECTYKFETDLLNDDGIHYKKMTKEKYIQEIFLNSI